MFNHYLTSAMRHFRRHKVTAAINVICLALGLLCFIAVYGMTHYLRNTDAKVTNAQRIVAITQKTSIPGTDQSFPEYPVIAFGAAKYLRTDFPELVAVAREGTPHDAAITYGDTRTYISARTADPDFFAIFDYPFLAGDRAQALRQPRSVVVSEATAIQLFGSVAQAVGKTVLVYGRVDMTVVGVLGAIPQPAHVSTSRSANPQERVDMYVSMDIYENSPAGQRQHANWNTPMVSTFVVLPATGLTLAALREGLQSFGARHVARNDWTAKFDATPLKTYASKMLDGVVGTQQTGISSVTLFYVLGALVLFVACVNYANLASAQAATRSKEAGMRRVVGARRSQLILQHLFEAALLSLAALLIALAILFAVVAPLKSPVAAFVIETVVQSPSWWLATVALLSLVTLVAGAYPALALSKVSAVAAVRSAKTTPRGRLAAILVCCQFTTASLLLVAIIVMAQQNRSVEHSALAAMPDPVVSVSDIASAGINFDTLRNQLLAQPHIKSVSGSYVQLWGAGGAIASLSASADPQANRRMVSQERVQHEFFRTLEFKLLAGREFERDQANDSQEAVVIDRALAEQNGWSPQQAIGQMLYLWIPEPDVPARQFRVVGVVENRTTRLFGMGATSNVFFLNTQMAASPLIRIDRHNVAAAVAEIDAVWHRLAPRVAIKRQFADELLNRALETLQLVRGVFTGVATLALIIAVLGLIGMSLHTIGRRRHEIGVRKTLGASARGILLLLLKDFSKPVLIANLIAWPLGLVAMQMYLSVFAQRISLSWQPFAASLLATLLIAWAAVIFQALRAATVKPSTVLRYE